MNIFKSNSTSSSKSAALLPRRTVADVSPHLYKLYEELYIFNRRLSDMASALGGTYPVPAFDAGNAPEDICGRIFFDVDLLSNAITEMSHHIAQLEIVTGLRPLEGETGPATPTETPGARGSDEPVSLGVPGASQPPPFAS